jgi:Protein of unknown function (DUF2938)
MLQVPWGDMMTDFLLRSIVIGCVATLLLDLWVFALNRSFGFSLPNWAMVGRWFLHLPLGKIWHESIANSPGFKHELMAGWAAHYITGILFAGATLLIGGTLWTKAPTWPLPLAVGLVTVGCGWFILQPGMGNGVAASKRPDATRIRVLNILGHTVFGLGMWGAALLIRSY